MYLGSAHRNTVAADLFCTSYLYIPLEATVESLQVALYDAGRARNATKSIIAIFRVPIGNANCVFCFCFCGEPIFFTKSTKIVQPVSNELAQRKACCWKLGYLGPIWPVVWWADQILAQCCCGFHRIPQAKAMTAIKKIVETHSQKVASEA